MIIFFTKNNQYECHFNDLNSFKINIFYISGHLFTVRMR